MTESERIALTLALESGLPYVGLRGLTPTPACLLPSGGARADGRPRPLSLEDDMLRLACASPDVDLEAIRSRFPRMALGVSLSGVDEIRNVRAAMSEATA